MTSRRLDTSGSIAAAGFCTKVKSWRGHSPLTGTSTAIEWAPNCRHQAPQAPVLLEPYSSNLAAHLEFLGSYIGMEGFVCRSPFFLSFFTAPSRCHTAKGPQHGHACLVPVVACSAHSHGASDFHRVVNSRKTRRLAHAYWQLRRKVLSYFDKCRTSTPTSTCLMLDAAAAAISGALEVAT